MGAKLFIRILKHLHSTDARQYFVIKATKLNKLAYMRECPRGARKVKLPPLLPLSQVYFFSFDFPSFYKITHIYGCNDIILKKDNWMN